MSDPLSDSASDSLPDPLSDPLSAPVGEGRGGASQNLADDVSAAEASKDLLQQMEELLATVSASLAGLGADLRSSASRAGTPDDEASWPDAHG
ncbi:hypothetical protein AB0442_25750 [Kitasatospora sp. NPDC085895]|uniref:hypothetical protein n=1 Tax=Kitasatospora sp. NPDC085895 TaxID=3155057 RepID=UPI00344C6D04